MHLLNILLCYLNELGEGDAAGAEGRSLSSCCQNKGAILQSSLSHTLVHICLLVCLFLPVFLWQCCCVQMVLLSILLLTCPSSSHAESGQPTPSLPSNILGYLGSLIDGVFTVVHLQQTLKIFRELGCFSGDIMPTLSPR